MTLQKKQILELSNKSPELHRRYLQEAINVAENCKDVDWYGVGCVIVNSAGSIISTGFTGEIIEEGTMRHAEDVALAKGTAAGTDFSQKGLILYATLEPCSIRASGKTPCCHYIIDSGIKSVVYGAKEPFDEKLGVICEGDAVLIKAGVTTTFVKEMESQCLTSIVSKRKSS